MQPGASHPKGTRLGRNFAAATMTADLAFGALTVATTLAGIQKEQHTQ
jgi:hypothetical protein